MGAGILATFFPVLKRIPIVNIPARREVEMDTRTRMHTHFPVQQSSLFSKMNTLPEMLPAEGALW